MGARTGLFRAVFRAALRLLPHPLPRHAREMEEVAARRVRDAFEKGTFAGAAAALGETVDLLWTCVRLRMGSSARIPVRHAAVAALAVAVLTSVAVEVRVRPSVLTAAVVDSIDFHAQDPAGEFTLSIRRGRVVAASVDGRRVPGERIRRTADTIRILGPGGRPAVSVAFDPRRGRISWEAREPERGSPGARPAAAAADPPQREDRATADTLPPEGVVRVALRIERLLSRDGAALGSSIWPGFRPDTIPVRFVLPEAGALLVSWGERPLPEGYEPVADGEAGWRPASELSAASTGTSLGGRPVAQVVVRGEDRPEEELHERLLGTAVHEAFHVFAGSRSGEGRWLGATENSFLTSTYPVFDRDNERDLQLEGLLLLEALRAPSREGAVRAAERFLAVREARQRALGPSLAEFEMEAEMNEGLAEYALGRAASGTRVEPGRPAPEALLRTASLHRLQDLTGDPEQSIRLRYYSTGSALAHLLDRIAGEGWKERLEREDVPLQDALATALGYREREWRLRSAALESHGGEGLRRLAAARTDSLAARRLELAGEILAEPGIVVRVSMRDVGRSIGLCAMDPQNMLQGPDGLLLHTRFLRPCAGSALGGELTTPSVHDREAGTLSAVAGPEEEVIVTVGGESVELADGARIDGAEDVEIASPRLTLRSARADLVREGRRIELIPQP